MAFRFKVQRVNNIENGRAIILDGVIESGKVFVGSEGTLAGDPSRRIKVTGVGILCGRDPADPLIPLFIAQPNFPLADLEGAIIVG